MRELVSAEIIRHRIYLIRGQKVMLDRDLAKLYGVETKYINRAVKRNVKRFPADFMFRLSPEEASRFQIGTLKRGHNIKYLPYTFTENGVAMLSSVLNSERAIQVNIQIMRAFTKLREMLSTHRNIIQRLSDLERKFKRHDVKIRAIFDVIRDLVLPQDKPRAKIGFELPSSLSTNHQSKGMLKTKISR